MYKPQIAIIGSRELSPSSLSLLNALAHELVSQGYRMVTGGLGTLQQAVHEGAKSNPQHTDCDTIVLLPLYALKEEGYKKIIELSSLSYLSNDKILAPHLDFAQL